MDLAALGRLADPAEFNDVIFGKGVVLYGDVYIGPGSRIGDYSIIGVPFVDDFSSGNPLDRTEIGPQVHTGSYCVIHNGAIIGAHVRIDGRCSVGPESEIGDDTQLLYGTQIHWKVQIGKRCIVGGFCCDRSIVGDKVIMLGKLIHKLKNPIVASWDKVKERSPNIQQEAFIGFDALVIGEVTVQQKAYIAAGAIVCEDVLPSMLAIGTKQYTREEWEREKKRRSEE